MNSYAAINKLKTKKKAILFIPGFSPWSYCIVEKIYISWAIMLSDKYDVYWLIAEPNAVEYEKYIDKSKVHVVHIGFNNVLKKIIFYFSFIKRNKIKAIITAFSLERFTATFVGKILGAKTIWNECWLSINGKLGFLKAIYYRIFIDIFIANSNFTKFSLIARGIKSNRVFVNYRSYLKQANPILNRDSLGLDGDDIVIGMVGAFRSEKNHIDLIKIFLKIANQYSNLRLLLIGGEGVLGNNTYRKILDLIHDFTLQNKVILTGYRKDVDSIYAAMDIFAFTSIDEPWGNAVIEAMGAGLPVVAYDSGGYAEFITNGQDGYLVHQRDLISFEMILVRLINDSQLRMDIGKNAKRKIFESKELDFDFVLNNHVMVVNKLLG